MTSVTPSQIKLSRLRRLSVYAVAVGLWLSGAVWLIAHYWLVKQGEYGPQISPIEPWTLDTHGGFAMLAIWALGLLWGIHVLAGWGARRGRWSGGILLGAMAVLMLSGYLLYYMADEDLRGWTSLIHWALGLATLPLFVWHRFTRKPRRPSRNQAAGSSIGPLARQRSEQ